MIEQDAKGKECRAPGVAYDLDGMGNWVWPSCIGSGCMHWVVGADPVFEVDPIKMKTLYSGRCGLGGGS